MHKSLTNKTSDSLENLSISLLCLHELCYEKSIGPQNEPLKMKTFMPRSLMALIG